MNSKKQTVLAFKQFKPREADAGPQALNLEKSEQPQAPQETKDQEVFSASNGSSSARPNADDCDSVNMGNVAGSVTEEEQRQAELAAMEPKK